MEVRQACEDELDRCWAVRRIVFIEEQRVPEDLEVDGLDPECVHFVALEAGRVIGTARLRPLAEPGLAKAERVAVLAEHRRLGVGARLMDALEAEARRRGLQAVVLNAQASAIEFYHRRGYVELGPRFDEAGIPHQKMRLSVS